MATDPLTPGPHMATDPLTQGPLTPGQHMATGVRKPTESGQFEDGDEDDVVNAASPRKGGNHHLCGQVFRCWTVSVSVIIGDKGAAPVGAMPNAPIDTTERLAIAKQLTRKLDAIGVVERRYGIEISIALNDVC